MHPYGILFKREILGEGGVFWALNNKKFDCVHVDERKGLEATALIYILAS